MSAAEAIEQIKDILKQLEGNNDPAAMLLAASLHTLLGVCCGSPEIIEAWMEQQQTFNRFAIDYYKKLEQD